MCVWGKVLCVSGGGCRKESMSWERLCKRMCGSEGEGRCASDSVRVGEKEGV